MTRSPFAQALLSTRVSTTAAEALVALIGIPAITAFALWRLEQPWTWVVPAAAAAYWGVRIAIANRRAGAAAEPRRH